MEGFCKSLYRRLQEDLSECHYKQLCDIQEAEQCFKIANEHWSSIKTKMTTYTFLTEEKEIHFFKRVKPKFTSQIEYYTLRYHAAVFEPVHPLDATDFWVREYRRLERFEAEYKTFLHCYRRSQCETSAYYFLTRHASVENIQAAKLYDAGSRLITNGDHLVASFLALQRLRLYAEAKLGFRC